MKRLYIDIDGVINTMRRGKYKIHVITDPDNPASTVSISMDSEAVRAFLDQFDEVVWASSWVNYQPLLEQLERTLGLPVGKFDRIVLDRDKYRQSDHRSSGKAEAVAAHYDANPMPSLWLDDDLGPEDRRVAESRDITLYAPNPATGGYKFFLRFGLGL